MVDKKVTQSFTGAEYTIDFLPKIKIDLVIDDNMLDQVLDVIKSNAQTGRIGDGKIFISNIEDIIRIRTGETGNDAI